jgi:lipopolysaccharide transport system ATP-binding protein
VIALRAEGLSKEYRIGGPRRPTTLRDTLTGLFRRRPTELPDHSRAANAPRTQTFWALRDVSFSVEQGEIIGIVGPNGAGKSTLLKLLSRITEPTRGTVDIYGRVGSLLEVGTGFHPELTGRENIFLNGAILGMRRFEIAESLDAIVAFSEVERFIDTPVKFYSSGMYLRLAFAVAAHLRPEILIVDEVLAVGDAQFQRKCLRKMQEVSGAGRTVLFVSHNLSAVRNICTRGLAIERGQLVDEDEVNAVIDRYLMRAGGPASHEAVVSTELFDIEGVDVRSDSGSIIKTFDDVTITVRLRAKRAVRDPGLYVGILTLDHQRVTGLDFKDFATADSLKVGEVIELSFRIDAFPLLPGSYQIELHVKDMAALAIEFAPRTFPFDVAESVVYGGRKIDQWYGLVGLRARVSARVEPEAPAAADAPVFR